MKNSCKKITKKQGPSILWFFLRVRDLLTSMWLFCNVEHNDTRLKISQSWNLKKHTVMRPRLLLSIWYHSFLAHCCCQFILPVYGMVAWALADPLSFQDSFHSISLAYCEIFLIVHFSVRRVLFVRVFYCSNLNLIYDEVLRQTFVRF